jgi:hypothetical protein
MSNKNALDDVINLSGGKNGDMNLQFIKHKPTDEETMMLDPVKAIKDNKPKLYLGSGNIQDKIKDNKPKFYLGSGKENNVRKSNKI